MPMSAGIVRTAKMVWVKDDKGGIRPNPIKTGIDNGTNVEVLSGLKEGDEVIISMTGDGSAAAKKNQSRAPGAVPILRSTEGINI